MRWKSGPLARSNDIRVLNSFEWLCKHNGLRPKPIRFIRINSGYAQSDGKSVNRWLPVLDLTGGFTAVKRLGMRVIWALRFPALQCSIKFTDFNTLRNELCVSLRMRYCWASFCSWINHNLMPYHVWMKSFTALNRKERTLLVFELNYHDKNTSLHVSLRTRKFDNCCRDIFCWERYIKETPLLELCLK